MGLNVTQKKQRSEYLEQNLVITECSQRKPYAFISYASDNWEIVFKSAVVPLQKQYGMRTYADKAFDRVNDKWIVPMLRNVRGADVMIAFVSQSYIESYACFLELLTAINNKKQIVFVSLGDQLHLGDTTDQPNIERGVKNEILNQGGNIATNTNNTSNDIMRAMKSAYTSLSTLLEQDALSRYDISDAFINFFRDASINIKTINDLGAIRGTIDSVSSDVFDLMMVSEPVHTVETAPFIEPAEEPVSARQETIWKKDAAIGGDAGAGTKTDAPPRKEPGRQTEAGPKTEAEAQKGSSGLSQYTKKLKNDPKSFGLALGVLSVILLCTPLSPLAIATSIAGVFLNAKCLKESKKTSAVVGLVLSGLVFLFFVMIL